jgi:hypothetical protein
VGQRAQQCGRVRRQNNTYRHRQVWTYNLAPLCNWQDYVVNDTSGHMYYFNICGLAHQNCRAKSYKTVYEYGVAVQVWISRRVVRVLV